MAFAFATFPKNSFAWSGTGRQVKTCDTADMTLPSRATPCGPDGEHFIDSPSVRRL